MHRCTSSNLIWAVGTVWRSLCSKRMAQCIIDDFPRPDVWIGNLSRGYLGTGPPQWCRRAQWQNTELQPAVSARMTVGSGLTSSAGIDRFPSRQQSANSKCSVFTQAFAEAQPGNLCCSARASGSAAAALLSVLPPDVTVGTNEVSKLWRPVGNVRDQNETVPPQAGIVWSALRLWICACNGDTFCISSRARRGRKTSPASFPSRLDNRIRHSQWICACSRTYKEVNCCNRSFHVIIQTNALYLRFILGLQQHGWRKRSDFFQPTYLNKYSLMWS